MKNKKNVLVVTGGGDCPGLNAVIRGISKRARREEGWQILGSIEAFNGVFKSPPEIVKLGRKRTAGIHVKGGTILKTTNKGNPLNFPMKQSDGSIKEVNRIDDLIKRMKKQHIYAVINIGGDGSQKISLALQEKGFPVVGVPKTIDNDLSGTDLTFGFRTAVQIASDAFDKLVTTAESHHRVMIMEVMGRDAGWIALHTAIGGGAEVCLIPEIPYDPKKVVERINERYTRGRGFVNIVVAEGAKTIDGRVITQEPKEVGRQARLGGIAYTLSQQLKEEGCKAEIRETVLGHIQRGGTPIAFDRILATIFGVKAFEMVMKGEFGRMVAYKNNDFTSVPLEEAVSQYHYVNPQSYMVQAAKNMGISFGD